MSPEQRTALEILEQLRTMRRGLAEMAQAVTEQVLTAKCELAALRGILVRRGLLADQEVEADREAMMAELGEARGNVSATAARYGLGRLLETLAALRGEE